MVITNLFTIFNFWQRKRKVEDTSQKCKAYFTFLRRYVLLNKAKTSIQKKKHLHSLDKSEEVKRNYICPRFISWLIDSFVFSLVCSLASSFIRFPFFLSFVFSCARLFVRSFIRSLFSSLVGSFVRSCIHCFIRSYSRLSSAGSFVCWFVFHVSVLW